MESKSLPRIAYFCMEYGLDSNFKTYAGGLGILAGDYIKGAKDDNLPITAIGIKWKQGYGDQAIDKNGKPFDMFHDYDYDFLIDTGIKVPVTIRREEILCKVWKVNKFNNADLYLLDTDIKENSTRLITGQLYGWFGEERIAQEIVLGIGGIRALRALGINIDVYHFNEGHAVLAATELIKEKISIRQSFSKALKNTRKEIVFTTHTPIIHGNEEHPIEKLKYMGAFNGLSKEQMIELGGKPFNMTVAALRVSRKTNAVAKLHSETSNKMWKKVKNKSEIIGITNAIHVPTWVDERLIGDSLENDLLWNIHMELKRDLISFIESKTKIKLLDDKLLIGFSRRAASYKRSNLIFSNPTIIDPLLKEGKIQIVFSGKAHPFDNEGKEIIADLIKMVEKYPNSVVYLENYDMEIGAKLTRGSDVWLNNPRRPMEASGTSGMKAAMNGVLNCSILDGWWPEACIDGINGWQFGNGFECDDLEQFDKHDAEALYEVLIKKVIPTYYENRLDWINMMQESIKSTQKNFSMHRMLEEYFELLYKK